MKVIVVGGGIAGLTLALSLHQAGIAVRLYEAVPVFCPPKAWASTYSQVTFGRAIRN